jgi:hypothetical protein
VSKASANQAESTDLLIREMEAILTIDGQGRPAKARRLLSLLEAKPEEVKAVLREIQERPWF